jgi:thymidylate synthase ThyX
LAQRKSSRVLSIGPLAPEKLAYALARYSRSPDGIRASLDWVRVHDSSKFLESFYFQYGHASIADLGHLALCFEGVSELAAVEIEDEQLWDGQARSSRYQDFSRSGFVTPPEFGEDEAMLYRAAGLRLMGAYQELHARALEHMKAKLPRPAAMKEDAYERNLAARAFDVARYVLFLGVPTGVGQVTSIRTLEGQIRRLKASEYAEVRELGAEAADACAAPPGCVGSAGEPAEAVAPTLAKYVAADPYPPAARAAGRQWAEQNLGPAAGAAAEAVELVRPADTRADIAATLLYTVTDRPFRELYEAVSGWSRARQAEVIDAAVSGRGQRDELLREFRGGPYAFDIVMDIGAYRDLHRHRRCQQFRQAWTDAFGWATPALIGEAGLAGMYERSLRTAAETRARLRRPGADYLLPFAQRSRFLFKMDFAEAEYISRLRSGVKGHFSYRAIAWGMKLALEKEEPELGRLIQATPPWEEDPLVR